jgi:hypothetical protein
VGSGCAVIVFGGALPVSVALNTATVPIGNGNTYYLNTAVAMATGVAGFTVRGAYVAFSLPPTALLYCWDHAYVGPLRYGYVGCAPSVLYSSSAPGANGVPPAYVPGKDTTTLLQCCSFFFSSHDYVPSFTGGSVAVNISRYNAVTNVYISVLLVPVAATMNGSTAGSTFVGNTAAISGGLLDCTPIVHFFVYSCAFPPLCVLRRGGLL